jgi:hypothetical protein
MLKYVIKSLICQDILTIVGPNSMTFIETNFFLPVRELFFEHVKHHKEIEASGDRNLLSADILYVNILMLVIFL